MKSYQYKSAVYKEISNKNNPFLTEDIFIKGYNINEELLPKIDFIDWIGVTFFEEKIKKETKDVISKLPMLVSNKGFKDPGILSSSMAAATNNPNQNCLISMVASSGGLYKGSKEIETLSLLFHKLNRKEKLFDIDYIAESIIDLKGKEFESYGVISHILGFSEWHSEKSYRIQILLKYFSNFPNLKFLKFVNNNQHLLEEKVKQKIDIELLISAIFYDINVAPDAIEFFYFFLLMPFTNLIKTDQRKMRSFPFYQDLFLEEK